MFYKLKLSIHYIIFCIQVFHSNSMFDSNAPIFTLTDCRLVSCPVFPLYCNVRDGGNHEECLCLAYRREGWRILSLQAVLLVLGFLEWLGDVRSILSLGKECGAGSQLLHTVKQNRVRVQRQVDVGKTGELEISIGVVIHWVS